MGSVGVGEGLDSVLDLDQKRSHSYTSRKGTGCRVEAGDFNIMAFDVAFAH
jgi:hypothetical protein